MRKRKTVKKLVLTAVVLGVCGLGYTYWPRALTHSSISIPQTAQAGSSSVVVKKKVVSEKGTFWTSKVSYPDVSNPLIAADIKNMWTVALPSTKKSYLILKQFHNVKNSV